MKYLGDCFNVLPPEDADEWRFRWSNFTPREVLSDGALDLISHKRVYCFDFGALDLLQSFREWLNESILVNHGRLTLRGVRTLQEVYELNGGDFNVNSFHPWCAFDCSSPGMVPEELASAASEFNQQQMHVGFDRIFGGIGIYDSFVHLDARYSFTSGLTQFDGESK